MFETTNQHLSIYIYGGFLKWGYPNFAHGLFHETYSNLKWMMNRGTLILENLYIYVNIKSGYIDLFMFIH